MHRKAQGLTLDVIVIASLCVIVLVVLILIFSKNSGDFQHQINDCEVKGGKCVSNDNCRGVVIGASCGEVSSEVVHGIDYATLGSETVCCLVLSQ